MPKVVLEMIILILQRIECFVFDLPTRTTASDQMTRVVASDRQIGDPTEAIANRTIRRILGVLQEVHQQIGVRFIQRQTVGETNLALHRFLLGVVRPAKCGDSALGLGLAHLIEEMFVIVWLGSQDEVHLEALQLADVRSVTGQAIFHNDQFHVRMFVSNLLQQTLARVAFAVVFVVAVLLDDRLRRERNDLLVIGMHHCRSQHLMMVGDLACLAVLFLQAGLAMNLFRRKVSGAIHRHQITAFMKGVRFQGLPALQLSKDIVEEGPEQIRFERIENRSHLRVAGNVEDAKKALHILVVATFLKGQQRRIFQGEHREGGHHGIGDGVTAIGFVARIRKLLGAQANLPNERIKGKMPPCFGRNGIGVQHERDSEDVFAIALQVPLRAAMIHQLPLNACPSQKKSEHQDASMEGLRNASRNSCGFAAESERIWRGQELLDDAQYPNRTHSSFVTTHDRLPILTAPTMIAPLHEPLHYVMKPLTDCSYLPS